MNPEPISYSPHDSEAADHDEPYTWGRTPGTYLSEREIVRLTIFRSRLKEQEELPRAA